VKHDVHADDRYWVQGPSRWQAAVVASLWRLT